jgi:hypothetical protein
MKSSLSKKNGVCTTAGAGVNPVFSYKKFKKMQKLDREISRLKKRQFITKMFNPKQHEKDLKNIEILDTKRKETRLTNNY